MADQLQDATLDGIRGLGEVKVVRARSGGIVGIAGTWRPAEGSEAETSSLQRANSEGRDVVYLGPIAAPSMPTTRSARRFP
jgi:hypothetical protein